MRILKKDGNVTDKVDALGRTPHQKNMEYLNRNLNLKNTISVEVIKRIKEFLQDVNTNQEGYMNSADIAYSVSSILNLPHNNKYNLVGSILFEEIEAYDCTVDGLDKNLVVIASKGDNQHYFDYFVDKKTVIIFSATDQVVLS